MKLPKKAIAPQSELAPQYSGVEELLNTEEGLPRYNNDIFKKLSRGLQFPPNSDSVLIDFGAGTGTLAKVWRQRTSPLDICIVRTFSNTSTTTPKS